MNKELEMTKNAVRLAGAAIMEIGKTLAPDHGADRTVLTQADLEADRILKEILTGNFANYRWLSEETVDDKSRLDSKRIWIVDPIDGTREFVMKNPEFVVSVALAEDNDIVLAVIYNPTTNDLYEAVKGQGARLNGQPIKVNSNVGEKLLVDVSRSDVAKGRFKQFESLINLHPCGSIAFKLARLAAGQTDSTISVTPKNEWDIAAGVLLVTEAGGLVTDLDGNKFTFNQSHTLVNGVIAAGAAAYNPIKEILDKVR